MRARMAWPPFTPNIQYIIGTLALLFFLTVLSPALKVFVFEYFLVSGAALFERFQIWTLVTYGFWHLDGYHLFFNGFALWMFGGHVDRRFSNERFWRYNLYCLLGGGLFVAFYQLLVGGSAPTLGYSGAVMGLVAAFCWYNWNRRLYFFFFPISGKYLLLGFFLLDFVFVVGASKSISVVSHLGGVLTGLFVLGKYWRKSRLKRLWLKIKRLFR